MINPKLSDRIIAFLLSVKKWQGVDDIALAIGISKSEAEAVATELAVIHSNWVSRQEYIGSESQFLIFTEARFEVAHFLKQGGFTKEQERVDAIAKRDEEMHQKHLEHLEFSTAQAKQVIKDSKFAKVTSWASLLIAVAAAIISVAKD